MDKSKALQIIRKTRSIYNTIAKEWDISRFKPSPLKKMLLKGVKQGHRVLDLGCGNGLMAREVVARKGQYFGLDVSSKLIAIAKNRNKELIKNNLAIFTVGNALKLPYKNNVFDFIFSFAVLHHIPSEELRIKFLSEIYRVLKPGRTAVIKNWNLLSPWANKKYKIEMQLKKKIKGFDSGDVIIPWKATPGKIIDRYLHNFSDDELRRLAKAAGFKNCRIRYYSRDAKKKKDGEDQELEIKKSR